MKWKAIESRLGEILIIEDTHQVPTELLFTASIVLIVSHNSLEIYKMKGKYKLMEILNEISERSTFSY